MTNAGAIPITISWGQEVFDALNNEKLDGLMVNIDSGYDIKAHKVAPNILTSQKLWLGHDYIIAMYITGWEKLSDFDKKSIEKAADISYKKLGKIMNVAYVNQIKILRNDGANVRILSDEEVEFWKNITNYETVQEKWLKEQSANGLKNAEEVLKKISHYIK